MDPIEHSPFLRLLRAELGPRWWWLVGVASLSGLVDGSMVAIINQAAATSTNGMVHLHFFVLFLLSLGLFVVSRRYLLIEAGDVVEEIIRRIRLRVAAELRKTDLLTFDRLGHSDIHVRLSQDSAMLSTATLPVFNSFGHAVMLVFCGVYIAVLSRTAFVVAVLLNVLGVLHFYRSEARIQERLEVATHQENAFFASLSHMLEGFKEIKMSRRRNADLFDNYLVRHSEATYVERLEANRLFVGNFIFSQVFFYILIATIVFLLPALGLTEGRTIIELTAVILFSIGPLSGIVMTLPVLAKANVAVNNLTRLERNMIGNASPSERGDGKRLRAIEAVETLELRGATFAYRTEAGEADFRLGPADLTVEQGEILFLVGGNGSGKSTLLKVLTGLYPVEAGEMRLNGLRLAPEEMEEYREFFSVIFADFHLFDRLYGIDADPEKVRRLLEWVEIADKTDYRDGRFTRLELSTGQRKRIALVCSLLEDRPICVFDEVAADQDPTFKARFYREILPTLREEGKTLIVVSHDDHYFHVADRVLRMDFGKLGPYEVPPA